MDFLKKKQDDIVFVVDDLNILFLETFKLKYKIKKLYFIGR